MPADEADRLLGGGTGLVVPASGSIDERDPHGSLGFKDGSLELWAGPDGRVCLLGYDAVDGQGRFQGPTRLGTEFRQEDRTPTREALLDGLDRLGCAWRRDDALTFGDQAAVETEAGVSVVFVRAEVAAGEWLVSSLYATAPEVGRA
ncbi:hypothetical protein [Streptomyces sp. CO7]